MHKYTFFSGKGGVGKTTLAAATAVRTAQAGKRTLIVSTDPASNLADVFERPIGPRVTEIAPNLFALEIDPDTATKEYGERALAPLRAVLPPDAMKVLEEQFRSACTVEIASFDRFTDFLGDTEFDHVVFDTAPTGHTLRLLELPVDWSRHIEEAAQGNGQTCIGPVASLQGAKAKYDHAIAALRDPGETEFTLVCRPERTSVDELLRAREELRMLGIGNFRIVVNGVIPVGAGGPFANQSSSQREQVRRLSGKDRPTLHRGAPPGRGSEGAFRPGAVRRHRLRRKGRFPPRRIHGNPRLHGVFSSVRPEEDGDRRWSEQDGRPDRQGRGRENRRCMRPGGSPRAGGETDPPGDHRPGGPHRVGPFGGGVERSASRSGLPRALRRPDRPEGERRGVQGEDPLPGGRVRPHRRDARRGEGGAGIPLHGGDGGLRGVLRPGGAGRFRRCGPRHRTHGAHLAASRTAVRLRPAGRDDGGRPEGRRRGDRRQGEARRARPSSEGSPGDDLPPRDLPGIHPDLRGETGRGRPEGVRHRGAGRHRQFYSRRGRLFVSVLHVAIPHAAALSQGGGGDVPAADLQGAHAAVGARGQGCPGPGGQGVARERKTSHSPFRKRRRESKEGAT